MYQYQQNAKMKIVTGITNNQTERELTIKIYKHEKYKKSKRIH